MDSPPVGRESRPLSSSSSRSGRLDEKLPTSNPMQWPSARKFACNLARRKAWSVATWWPKIDETDCSTINRQPLRVPPQLDVPRRQNFRRQKCCWALWENSLGLRTRRGEPSSTSSFWFAKPAKWLLLCARERVFVCMARPSQGAPHLMV